MNKLIYIIIFLGGFQLSHAQQLPIFTQYQEAYSLLNPAAVSSNYLKYEMNMNTNAMYRYQWVGIEGAPQTTLISHEWLNEDLNFLAGGSFTYDQTGPTSFLGLSSRFAYLLRLNRNNFITAGITAGLVQYRVDGSQLEFQEQGEVEDAGVNTFRPDFSLGAVWYYMPRRGNRYFAGISVPQTFGFNLAFRTENNEFNIQRVQHYYAFGGAQFDVGEGSWLETDVWFKYVENIPFHFDVNVRYEYRQIFWVGAGGSMSGASHLETGIIWNIDGASFLRIGYGYDHFFTDYGPAFGDAHELKVTYMWQY